VSIKIRLLSHLHLTEIPLFRNTVVVIRKKISIRILYHYYFQIMKYALILSAVVATAVAQYGQQQQQGATGGFGQQ
jgi:hypothetical protein